MSNEQVTMTDADIAREAVRLAKGYATEVDKRQTSPSVYGLYVAHEAIRLVRETRLATQSPSSDIEAERDRLREALRRALLAADNLYSELEAHQENTGEDLEPDDQAVVASALKDMAFARAARKETPNVG